MTQEQLKQLYNLLTEFNGNAESVREGQIIRDVRKMIAEKIEK